MSENLLLEFKVMLLARPAAGPAGSEQTVILSAVTVTFQQIHSDVHPASLNFCEVSSPHVLVFKCLTRLTVADFDLFLLGRLCSRVDADVIQIILLLSPTCCSFLRQ